MVWEGADLEGQFEVKAVRRLAARKQHGSETEAARKKTHKL